MRHVIFYVISSERAALGGGEGGGCQTCNTMYQVEFLSLHPMFPPKHFDCSGGLAAFRFFLNLNNTCYVLETVQLIPIKKDNSRYVLKTV